MAEIVVIRQHGSGELQIMVDGVEFDRAAFLTLALAGEIPGFTLTSAVEQHKNDGPSHAHIVATNKPQTLGGQS